MAKKKTTKKITKKSPTKKTKTKPQPSVPDKALIGRARKIIKALEKQYPDATCALIHRDAFQLLVATILSAQCTDERVNKVTPALFKKFPTAKAMSNADIKQLEELVHSTGFYRNKAKSLLNASGDIVQLHGGDVPNAMAKLTALHGVARKTANVVLGNAFGINEGVVVDTHVKRLSNRMGLTTESNTDKIEKDLMALFPQKKWTLLSHLLIFLGRGPCKARKTECDNCCVNKLCPKVGQES